MSRIVDSLKFQEKFLETVRERLPDKRKVSSYLMTRFGLSPSAAHRRISGEIHFPLHELLELSMDFNISLDEILSDQPNAGIQFNQAPRISSLHNLKLHLEQVLSQIEMLRKVSDAVLYYAARDLPLFFYFRYPNLAAFKVNVWLNGQSDQQRHIDLSVVPESILKLGKQLSLSYNELSTVELWSHHSLSNVFDQVAYFYRAGYLPQKDALDILVDVGRIIDDREKSAQHKSKQGEYRAELYVCDYILMANGALAKVGSTQMAWIAYSGVDLIRTNSPRFCTDYEEAFKWHIQLGVGISGSATDRRLQFFDELRQQLESTKSKILRGEVQ